MVPLPGRPCTWPRFCLEASFLHSMTPSLALSRSVLKCFLLDETFTGLLTRNNWCPLSTNLAFCFSMARTSHHLAHTSVLCACPVSTPPPPPPCTRILAPWGRSPCLGSSLFPVSKHADHVAEVAGRGEFSQKKKKQHRHGAGVSWKQGDTLSSVSYGRVQESPHPLS